MKCMQKPLTPKQQLEFAKLELASKHADHAMREAELVSGKNSPQYAVAERLKDEIVAKMQRITRELDGTERNPKPAGRKGPTVVVKSKRVIRR